MKFEDHIKQFQLQRGAIYYAGRRLVIVEAEYLAGLQQKMEEIIGTDGTFAIIRDASLEGGRRIAKALVTMFKDLLPEELIKAFFKLLEFGGFGLSELKEFSLDPFKMTVTCENTYLAGTITGASEPRCLFFTMAVAFIEALLKEKGYDKEFTYEETQCVAKGDNICESKFSQND